MYTLFATFILSATALSCKDEGGEDVGSWVLLKFPQSTSYVYDTNTFQSPYSLNDTEHGALAYTMQQFWFPDTRYVLYNDEPPFQTSYNFSVAHAKAALLWDNSSAIGIFHSIPKFPVGPEKVPEYRGLLSNAWDYAQHVACITISIEELPSLQTYLASMTPNVYEGGFEVAPQTLPQNACAYTTTMQRILIVKSSEYPVDIWATCVSQHFQTDLQVMSWIHGTMEGTIQNITTTTDISEISYPFGESYGEWNNHAKWAIGTEPFVCVGDMNRVETQKERSGAALCWKDSGLWTAWKNIVSV